MDKAGTVRPAVGVRALGPAAILIALGSLISLAPATATSGPARTGTGSAQARAPEVGGANSARVGVAEVPGVVSAQVGASGVSAALVELSRFYVPGRGVPVAVEITSPRLLQATLEVSSSRATPVRVPVEVPGGSTRLVVAVVPTRGEVPAGRPAGIRVRVLAGGRSVTETTGTLGFDPGAEIVAVLPGVVASRGRPPASTRLDPDVGVARFVAVGGPGPSEDLLDLAPSALGPFSTVLATPADLETLAPDARSGLLSWLGSGGSLLLDAPRGTRAGGLPEPWQQATSDRWTAAGQGRIRLVGSAIDASPRTWDGVVSPSAWFMRTRDSGESDGNLANALGGDGAFKIPGLGWLLGFLVIYLLLAGPVTFGVLRRRQRLELAWVVIPTLAVVFTAASVVAGQGLRSRPRLGHVSVVMTDAGGGQVQSGVGVFLPQAGNAGVQFPNRWYVSSASVAARGVDRDTSVTRTGSGGPRANLSLGTGESGLVVGSGRPAGGGLVVTASADSNEMARGTVRNETGLSLQAVTIFVASGLTLVGDMEPDEIQSWSVRVRPGLNQQGPAEYELWQPFTERRDSPVNFALWERASAMAGMHGTDSGNAVAVGWTRDYLAPVSVPGTSLTAPGRTVFVGRGPLGGSTPNRLNSHIEMIRGSSGWQFERGIPPGFADGEHQTLLRVTPAVNTLPTGPAVGSPRLAIASSSATMTIWTASGWQPLGCSSCGAPGRNGAFDADRGQFVHEIPSGVGPEFYVRLDGHPGSVRYGNGVHVVVEP
ncbi:MAG: hypothetical protein ACT4OS_04925 [Acidimicrobiales bacterium]